MRNGAFLKQAMRSVRQKGTKIIPYALGRFYIVRKAYSVQAQLRFGTRLPEQTHQQSIFPDADIDAATAAILRDAVYLPVFLPTMYVEQFRELALRCALSAKTAPREFSYGEVKDGRLVTGHAVPLGHVVAIENHPLAQMVAKDPKVLEVMSRYLKYTPRNCDIRLYWSFAGSFTDDERRAADQTYQFHFDVHSYNFAYAAYYITDTDHSNGAHVMVPGSHRKKPAAWLFGSANQDDAAVEAYYGREHVLMIEGRAGMGFWQDSSCYHKALAPKDRDRLLLQVRYS